MPPTPKARAPKPSARQNIAAVINEATSKVAVRRIVDSLMGAEIVAVATCEDCGGRMKVPVPDVKRQIDGLTALLQEADGRPGQQAPGALTVVVERPPLG